MERGEIVSLGLIITIITMTLLFLRVAWHLVKYNRKVPSMTGMMAAMTIGMLVGITSGTIIGIVFEKDLFHATILGMGIGLVAGGMIGILISVMAVLEGVLSGAMGGMMGAMLGVMMKPSFFDSIIKILFVFFVTITCLLIYMLDHALPDKDFKKKYWHHPIVMLTLLGLFFYVYNKIGPIF